MPNTDSDTAYLNIYSPDGEHTDCKYIENYGANVLGTASSGTM